MNKACAIAMVFLAITASHSSNAADEVSALAEKGKTLFWKPASCWVCHGEKAEERIGLNIR